ncbi:MAG: peptidylprolyl isomerase [Parcubacteria group bacterium]|jgi:cyclophilin family peptidyl-prolyl cis-trans isomerase
MKNRVIIIGFAVLAVAAAVFIIFALRDEPKKTAYPTEETMQDNNVQTNSNQDINQMENSKHIVTLETSLGNIKIETYDADAPKAAENFVKLVREGFYDGVIFHRVIDGFMIQGGDPTGTGRGGPGYTFEDELNPETESYKTGYKKGVVAMANAGPNTNGSQFFIMVADYFLSHDYTIFGKVIEGQDVADQIAKVEKDVNDRPLKNVTIKKASTEDK